MIYAWENLSSAAVSALFLCLISIYPYFVSITFRLLVNLTQPALLCFNNKVPTEVDQYHIYLKVLAYNQTYKQVGLPNLE